MGELEAPPRPYFQVTTRPTTRGTTSTTLPTGMSARSSPTGYVGNGGYSFDREVELDWMDDPILSGTDDEVSWSDGENRRPVASAVLERRLQRKLSETRSRRLCGRSRAGGGRDPVGGVRGRTCPRRAIAARCLTTRRGGSSTDGFDRTSLRGSPPVSAAFFTLAGCPPRPPRRQPARRL